MAGEARPIAMGVGGIKFGTVGGAGALLSKCIKSSEVICYDDLGAEAIGKNNVGPLVTDNADILIKEDANVVINYFGGDTGAKSVFAYYCYPKDASTDEIRKATKHACVIFPNAHGNSLGYYTAGISGAEQALQKHLGLDAFWHGVPGLLLFLLPGQ